jgi:hypothetical protein
MKIVYAYLNGGLGNQMFQYATAKAFAMRTSAELVLDTWSGFVRDHQYNRDYELNYLPIKAREATAIERIPIWLFRTENKLYRKKLDLLQQRVYGNFLVETESRFFEEMIHYRNTDTAWLVGYWQSPLYFQEITKTLCDELMPRQPIQKKFLDMGQIIRDVESVALGIRLYEESANPSAHAKDGLIKTVSEVNNAIERILVIQPKAKFFIFCTHRSPLLMDLNLPNSTVFLTHDDGFEGTIERLWLLAQCKHHIFTNSSYYWWGAWLSQSLYSSASQPQHIFAANNFINKDGICKDWNSF